MRPSTKFTTLALLTVVTGACDGTAGPHAALGASAAGTVAWEPAAPVTTVVTTTTFSPVPGAAPVAERREAWLRVDDLASDRGSYVPGERALLAFTVCNQGLTTARDARARVWLSYDTLADPFDLPLGEMRLLTLRAGETSEVTGLEVELPDRSYWIGPGVFFFVVETDVDCDCGPPHLDEAAIPFALTYDLLLTVRNRMDHAIVITPDYQWWDEALGLSRKRWEEGWEVTVPAHETRVIDLRDIFEQRAAFALSCPCGGGEEWFEVDASSAGAATWWHE
ncbi:MAG: hypothetical protein HY719_13020 [Planctomycetes bacterium]|nr:hypothetical protein [Planctomycetota bacterium]